MEQRPSTARRLDILINVAGFLGLFALATFSTQPPLYDEPHRLEVVEVLQEYGLSREFLREMPHATGPLTPVVQLALAPITHLRPPGIRVTNALFLAVTIALTGATLGRRGYGSPWANALAILALPTTWVVAGLALTEMPAIACVALAVFVLANLREETAPAGTMLRRLPRAAPSL